MKSRYVHWRFEITTAEITLDFADPFAFLFQGILVAWFVLDSNPIKSIDTHAFRGTSFFSMKQLTIKNSCTAEKQPYQVEKGESLFYPFRWVFCSTFLFNFSVLIRTPF